MPYTPPSHRSPASSAPTSPEASRRPSFQSHNATRPSLPRSASYLTRHRRTPSAVGPLPNAVDQISPEATSEDLKAMVNNSSVRQSPPPIADARGMPKGAIISPPESSSSGSDDDDLPEMRGRRIEKLKELHVAVSQIPQRRASSPDKTSPTDVKKPQEVAEVPVLPSQGRIISEGMHQSFSTGSLNELASGAKRISHARSVTESSLLVSKSAGNSLTGSEENSEDEMQRKPQMVRKKSGELVRPALRPSSRRRPSSMPGTPTFSKAVHFDSHLEHVRHFLQVDRPLAVSAGSSPVDNYDSDNEYPFPGDEKPGSRSPPYEWEIIMTNFPVETPARRALPVRLERVWLSNDQKCLVGSIAVANLAFQKSVVCRFTLDYWKTTSEVAAEFVVEIRPQEGPLGHDRFQFTIKLSDMANLESKTLFFCIRYSVNGQEHWDSNNGTNFQVDFRKKMLPQNGKKGVIGAASRPVNGLPRSNRRASPSTVPRPKSMPVSADEFGDSTKLNFDQSIHDYLGESGPTTIRLKGVKSSGNLPSDNLSSRLSAPSGQAFANRYDFGASLTAAVQAAKDSMVPRSEGLYMKSMRKPTGPPLSTKSATTKSAVPVGASALANKVVSPVTGADSPGASIASSSYEELVNKYCFFGSKQSSPQLKDGTLRSGGFDGSDDVFTRSNNSSTSSSTNSSPASLDSPIHAGRAQHHSLHPRDPSPYFQHTTTSSNAPQLAHKNHATSQGMGSPPHTQSCTVSGRPSGYPPPYAGTSPNESSFPSYQRQMHDFYPFASIGSETHAAAAIRG